ncbi:DUF5320 domain-containing protein [Candidatus Dependentiae bacterium]
MPKFDGKGPNGLGPMTGKGLGPCNQNNNNTINQPGRSQNCRLGFGQRRFGRGGCGLGLGRGCGYNFDAQQNIDNKTEINMIKNKEEILKQELKNIQEQLKKLNK